MPAVWFMAVEKNRGHVGGSLDRCLRLSFDDEVAAIEPGRHTPSGHELPAQPCSKSGIRSEDWMASLDSFDVGKRSPGACRCGPEAGARPDLRHVAAEC